MMRKPRSRRLAVTALIVGLTLTGAASAGAAYMLKISKTTPFINSPPAPTLYLDDSCGAHVYSYKVDPGQSVKSVYTVPYLTSCDFIGSRYYVAPVGYAGWYSSWTITSGNNTAIRYVDNVDKNRAGYGYHLLQEGYY
jgi:hypothetical protein